MMSLGSDLKNIISCKKKKKNCWLNSAFFPSFYTSGSGSTDPIESGSDRIRIHTPALMLPLFFTSENDQYW